MMRLLQCKSQEWCEMADLKPDENEMNVATREV